MHGSLMPALRILALGPNPALQRVLTFDAPIVPGGVNRATSVSTYVGGKGQGVALAVHRWAPGAAVCAQFVGGDHGCIVEAQLAAQGVECVSEHVSAETRQCTTLIGAIDSASSIPAPPMTSNSNPRRQFGSVRYERSDARLSFGSDLDAFFWIPLPTLIAHALTTVRVMAMTGMTLERADEGSRDARGALWGSRERARRRRTRRKLNGSSY